MARILVTNDDGYDAPGLHVLARRLGELGEVVVVAPDQEFSGAGAAIGALDLVKPAAKQVSIDGVGEAWAINGAPALCVILARFGLFGDFDLVVSGINPGANTGRAIYHSGTVGAALTARNTDLTGIAVSQRSAGLDIVGQASEGLGDQQWEAAAAVAVAVAGATLADQSPPAVINVNVPNLPLDRLTGFRHTEATPVPMRFLGAASMDTAENDAGYRPIKVTWVEPGVIDDESDEAALLRGEVAITFLSRLHAVTEPSLAAAIDSALTSLL